MLQLRSVTAPKTGWLKIVAPFMNQIEISPVTPLRHRMSDLPSPSKSPLPAMRQLRSVTVARLVAPPEIVVPFMSQIEFEPVALLCHRMSDLPSPLKSIWLMNGTTISGGATNLATVTDLNWRK